MHIACRPESASWPGEILVSEDAYLEFQCAFHNTQARELRLKGIMEQVPAYVLNQLRCDPLEMPLLYGKGEDS